MARDDTHERCGLPSGAVITEEVEFVAYLPPEGGQMRFTFRISPNSPANAVLGLIELGKHKLLHEAEEKWREENEAQR